MSASNASSRKTIKIWLSIAVPSSRRMAIYAGLLCFLYAAVTEGALATQKEGPNPDTKSSVETWYTVTENGVTVGDKTWPWLNRRDATLLIPLIVKKAKQHCDQVLFWQMVYKKSRKSPSSPWFQIDGLMAEKTCAAVLQNICASANAGAKKLVSDEDISVLCH